MEDFMKNKRVGFSMIEVIKEMLVLLFLVLTTDAESIYAVIPVVGKGK
jgi:hypothetical protein